GDVQRFGDVVARPGLDPGVQLLGRGGIGGRQRGDRVRGGRDALAAGRRCGEAGRAPVDPEDLPLVLRKARVGATGRAGRGRGRTRGGRLRGGRRRAATGRERHHPAVRGRLGRAAGGLGGGTGLGGRAGF